MSRIKKENLRVERSIHFLKIYLYQNFDNTLFYKIFLKRKNDEENFCYNQLFLSGTVFLIF